VAPDVPGRGICHDEKVYLDPGTFNPDRFLGGDGKIDPSVEDPEVRIFGGGRRWGSHLDLPLHCSERQ
jgi:cytochrome P450